MGVRESVGELEAAMAEFEGSAKAEPKAKKARETAGREDKLGRIEVRIGNIEGGIAELQENVGALQEKLSSLEIAKEKTGAGGYAAVEKRIGELESRVASARPAAGGRDYSADIAELRKSVSEIRNDLASGAAKGGEPKAQTKDLLELKSRMDVLQKYVDGKIGSIDRIIEDRLGNSASGGKEAELLKKHEGRISDIEKKQGEMLKIKEDLQKSLKDSLQHSMNGFKSGIDRHIADAAKKMDETASRIGKEQEIIRKDLNEKMNSAIRRTDERVGSKLDEKLKGFASRSDLERTMAEMKAAEERIAGKEESFRKELNAFASKADIDRLNNAVNGGLGEFSKKIEFASKFDLDKINSLANAEKALDEKMKLFALNSDVEKVWKEAESLRKYIDEKSKYADGLANSLRNWEARNMELAAREHDFDEKIKAFPELKLLDSRIRKMERAIADLQRHFVAAKMAEPIIME